MLNKKLGVIASHPIQYQAPIFRELGNMVETHVFFAHDDTPEDQAAEGFGVGFQWDRDLTSNYNHTYLQNNAKKPGFGRFYGCNTPEISGIIRVESFDAFLLMGWNLYSYWQAIFACKTNNVPVMVRGDSHLGTPRRAMKQMLKRPLYLLMLKLFDRCLYVGERNKKYYLNYGIRENKLVFSPHAVDNTWFEQEVSNLSKSELRRKYGIHEDSRVVLFSGKLIKNKRPLDLIYAVEGLKEKHEVVYAGAGDQTSKIVALAKKLNVKVRLLGFKNQSEMPAVYTIADILVLPSSSETWGLVVNEAMVCGIPVIVSDAVGCAPDLIDPGETGDTYPVGDVRALRNALCRILGSTSEQPYAEMVRRKIRKYTPTIAAMGVVQAMEGITQ